MKYTDLYSQQTEKLLRSLTKDKESTPHFDLHIHTTISDGSDSFKDVVIQARERNIETIAFTNHDTTVGLDYAVDLARSFGIIALGGVEISAWDNQRGRKVHILGYGLRSCSPAIRALCSPLLERRKKNTIWQMKQLLKAGYKIDESRLQEASAFSTSFYKQQLMAALLDEPFQSEAYRMLYKTLFKEDGLCARDINYVDAQEAIKAIVEDGGVAVLAHPGQLDSYDMVPELVACGLRGIEHFHPDHTSYDWKRCEELEQQYGLFSTGGSDYHGSFGKVPHLGYFEQPDSESRHLASRLLCQA